MTQRQMSPMTMCVCALLSFAFAVSALAQPTRWKEYVSEKGKFSVLLLGDPETDYRLGETDSITGLIYLINYQKDGSFCGVECFDLHAIPPDADAAKNSLERRRDKYSSASESTMLSLNGYPALEYKMRIDRHGVEIGRIILIRRRLYQLRVFTLTPANNLASEAAKFFDSFKPTPMTDEEIISRVLKLYK